MISVRCDAAKLVFVLSVAALATAPVVAAPASTGAAPATTAPAATTTTTTKTTAASDPFVGSWHVDIAKSNYAPGNVPKSSTTKTTALKNGKLKTVIDVVRPNGTKGHAEYTYAYDGKFYPIKTTAKGAAKTQIAYKRIDEHTLQIARKQGTKMMGVTTLTISADGKTETSTSNGKPVNGKPVQSIVVYERD